MKKAYITPSVEVIKAETSTVLAASIDVSETEVDTGADNVQLIREDKGMWDVEW